jgi:hypothetical protein
VNPGFQLLYTWLRKLLGSDWLLACDESVFIDGIHITVGFHLFLLFTQLFQFFTLSLFGRKLFFPDTLFV